ncbi:hypothetical protein [Melioribacter sp. OK-6-Me]|uniref:hypothetical protein n=1 Tax=unclassified Melioribacter TaxID=2627329 RepID=UPI003ED99FE7
MYTKKSLFASIILSIFLVFALIAYTGCEGTKTEPIVNAPPTPVEPTAPLVLNGYVKDAVTLGGIQGATVILANESGEILTTLATDNTGNYQYDVSNVPGAKLKVSAVAASYGAKKVTATIDKNNYIAQVPTAYLIKLKSVTKSVSATNGGQVGTTTTEAVTTKQVSVDVPAGALSSDTQISVAPITSNNVVPLPATSNKVITAAANFEPTGITFAKPVTVSFPLPYISTPGKALSVYRLNPSTLEWEVKGTATVDAEGTSASTQITGFSSWTVADNGTFSISSVNTNEPDANEQVVAKGNTISHSYTPILNITPLSGTVSESWVRNLISQIDVFGDYDLRYDENGNILAVTISYTASPQPALPDEYQDDLDGDGTRDHYNPEFPTQRGTWVWSAVVQRFKVVVTGTLNAGETSARITANLKVYKKVRDQWVWVPKHDQGAGG